VPDASYTYGQSLFGDFDSDGSFEHLVPCCKDKKCKQSAIFVYKSGIWSELPVDLGKYSFIPPDEAVEYYGQTTISLKAGDYDLNGYLDLMAVLKLNK
jgi:hypothetical protein